MTKKGVPRHLLDLGRMSESELLTHMVRGCSRRSGYEEVTGQKSQMSVTILNALGGGEETMEEGVKKQIEEVSSKLTDRLDDSNFTADHEGYIVSMDLDEIANLVRNKDVVTHEETTLPYVEEYNNMITEKCPDKDDEEAIDQCLTAELILALGTGGERVGRVIKRSQGPDGHSIGRPNPNQLFDTGTYDVQFTDGSVE
eukprot:5138828-Ditylum_brightwellii.AAC.1